MGYNSDALEKLIAGCKANNRKAQRELYELYAPRMVVVCLRYCGDYETARDLMHDGFVNIFTKLDSYKEDGPFEAWMRRIMVNHSLEYLRKKDPLNNAIDITETFDIDDSSDLTPLEEISANEILELVDKLPTTQRTVFNMHAIEGYSHAEIAEQLNINEATIRSHYLRAKRALQQLIEKKGI